MNNRLTKSKTSQSCQQDVKLNKTNRDAEAPSLPLAPPFLYALIDSDSCSAPPPANASLENRQRRQNCDHRHLHFCFFFMIQRSCNDACWENKHADVQTNYLLAGIILIFLWPSLDLWEPVARHTRGWRFANWLPFRQAGWLVHRLIVSKVIWLTDQISGWQT